MSGLWENPIFLRSRQVEARQLGPGPRGWLIRYGGSLLIALGPLGTYLLFGSQSVMRNPRGFVEDILGTLLGFSGFLLVVYCVSRALNGTFACICLEREQRTYDSLLATLLSAPEVAAGKLASGLWPMLRELIVVAPLALTLGTLAGRPGTALLFLLLSLVCTLFYGLLGLWTSYTSPASPLANRRATSLAALLMLGGPILDWFIWVLNSQAGGDFVPLFTFLSPLAAASSVGAGNLLWTGTFLLYAGAGWLLWRRICSQAQTARQG